MVGHVCCHRDLLGISEKGFRQLLVVMLNAQQEETHHDLCSHDTISSAWQAFAVRQEHELSFHIEVGHMVFRRRMTASGLAMASSAL